MTETTCPHCGSKHITKAGTRKLKKKTIQRFRCNTCLKYFTDRKIKQKAYSAKTILNAISTYNQGHTLKQTKKEMGRRFHIKIPISTIHSWIKQYSNICTFSMIREQATKDFPPSEMIISQDLRHKQIYTHKLHQAKLELLSRDLPTRKYTLLKSYLKKIHTSDFSHHIFQPTHTTAKKLSRSSRMDFQTFNLTISQKQNLANKLTELGLMLARTNKERHEAVQNFMITNDSATIATEVPVYLTQDDIDYFRDHGFTLNFKNHQTPITGHIDLLQLRNNLIHILDYKPQAEKITPTNQLTIYALALASRTKLAVKDFKCAWFDQNNYYQFFPLHGVYK